MPKTQRRVLWRADIEPWRWLILGSLGALASHCGGRAGADDDVDFTSVGGSGGSTAPGGSGGSGGIGRGGYGGSGGSIANGGAGAADHFPISCTGPTTDLGGGWQRCANGMIHRFERGLCPSGPPRSGPVVDAGTDAGALPSDAGTQLGTAPGDPNPVPGTCRLDSDCTQQVHGYCETEPGSLEAHCQYGCVLDVECGAGYACLCGTPFGQCVRADCKADGDCGNALCVNYTESPGCGGVAFQCQSTLDQCASDADCSSGTFCSTTGPSGDQGRKCVNATCVIGRPFLVDGEQRVAACVARSDWYSAGTERTAPPSGDLDPELRAALLAGWTAQGLMEHASVAAFARFALQLASLGAPPELLTRTGTAMLDEIRHARACFELARRFSDRELGPGPLPVAGALGASGWSSILTDCILEGCIGETVAAIEAAEALSHCEDPLARKVLEQIVVEESQHAELAWQFLAWSLQAGPAGLRQQAAAVFRAELARPAAPVLQSVQESEREQRLLQHGLLSSALRQALRARVLREVIAPCVEALFEPAPPVRRAPTRTPSPDRTASSLPDPARPGRSADVP